MPHLVLHLEADDDNTEDVPQLLHQLGALPVLVVPSLNLGPPGEEVVEGGEAAELGEAPVNLSHVVQQLPTERELPLQLGLTKTGHVSTAIELTEDPLSDDHLVMVLC